MNRCAALTAAVVIVLAGAPGCLVLGLDRFYDEPSIAFDERLLGNWKDTEGSLTATVERSDWRSYRIQYVHPTETGMLTGYLFKQGSGTFLDVTPVRGKDFGSFVIPAHALLRVAVAADGNEITITPLSFDWFAKALAEKTLPASLRPTKGERDQILLAATRPELQAWLAGRQPTDPAFGVEAVFKKQ